MFATTLPPLPPPASSLLPSLSQPTAESFNQPHIHTLQSRRKPMNRSNTMLTLLSNDERLIVSRKNAIAMYGHSWLKPAGCNKTMLGRKEEELEREEVERQLREVELQERMAMEQEDQERREELQRQAEGGETEGLAERDLDDEVPEAEEGDDEDGEGSGDGGDEGDEEDDMDGDLDDDIPDADAHESGWVYDTRRESDTGSEDDRNSVEPHENAGHFRRRQPAQPYHVGPGDPTTTEAVINAMLDEDELGEYERQHDFDDDVPDMDADMDMDMEADLSDEVPDAEDSPNWEHTDSELEESQMDISVLPHANSAIRNPGTTHEEIRRVSGNRMLPPSLPPSTGQSRAIIRQRQERHDPRTAPRRNLRATMATPGTADDISALISTGGMSNMGSGTLAQAEGGAEPQSPSRGNWLNPAGARRNLFGGFRGGVTGSTSSVATTGAGSGRSGQPHESQGQSRILASLARATVAGVSSGGLFTPSPRLQHSTSQQQDTPDVGTDDEDDNDDVDDEPRSRTRSGRLLGGLQAAGIGRRRRGGR